MSAPREKGSRFKVQGSIFIFLVLILGFWILNLAIPRIASAACYCQNSTVCRCPAPPPASAHNEASIGGVAVVCDTPEEANSLFAIKSPICGSSAEIVPACAPYKDNSGNYACYGRAYTTGHIDARITQVEDGNWITDVGPFTFNDFPYTAKDVFVCDANNFCCAPGENNPGCDDTNVPKLPGNCEQDYNITPPVEICGVVAGNPNPSPNFIGKSDTDARIYFPHVKNTSSIAYLLQSMYRPISWTIDQIKKNVVYSQIFEHQGIAPDDAVVINITDNNSSVIPDRPAPTPVFDFTQPPPGVPDNANCVIDNVRTNPGDDLLGKKIYADLEYTQKFEYDLVGSPSCITTGGTIGDKEATSACCSGSAHPGPDNNNDGVTDYWICNPAPIGLPTKGKTLVYTKSPFLEYLYQNLVAGPAAIYKRFVSASTAAEIKDIPTKSIIKVTSSAKEVVFGATPGEGNNPPAEIYFPHLGSIYDYFLKNLQKLLRPKGTADTTGFPTPPPSPSGGPINLTCQSSCNHPNLPDLLKQVAAVAGEVYGVPPSVIIGFLFSEGGLNSPITDAEVLANRQNGCNCPASYGGACGPGQFLGSFSYISAFQNKLGDTKVQSLIQNMQWQIGSSYSPNRCQFSDVMFGIAAKVANEYKGTDYVAQCKNDPRVINKDLCDVLQNVQVCAGVTMNSGSSQATSCNNWTKEDVVTAARQYLGYCEEPNHIPLYSYDVPRDICKNNPNECYQQKLLNFLASNCQQNFPPSPPAPSPTPTVSGGGFTVSGTPTQICQMIIYGIRQQAGTTDCVKCSQGKFVFSLPCPQALLNKNVCNTPTISDFGTYDIPPPVTPPWSPNTCALCYQKNVLNIQSCTTINNPTACPSTPTGNSCYANNQSPGQVCEPQFCPNPGNPGRFCCYLPTQPVTCEFGSTCSPTQIPGKVCFAQPTGCIQGSVTGNYCCRP